MPLYNSKSSIFDRMYVCLCMCMMRIKATQYAYTHSHSRHKLQTSHRMKTKRAKKQSDELCEYYGQQEAMIYM